MTEYCGNCDEKITDGGMFGTPNSRYGPTNLKIVNFINETDYKDLCEKCGRQIVSETIGDLHTESEACRSYIKSHIIDFPMMTISEVPQRAECKIKAMVTANVTVGTGLFNELSQGLSDMFGATNTNSGMALKINSGEATARSIIVNKAMALGANCVIAVDIDYGTTGNNAATVNIQGTAVLIANLNDILDEPDFKNAQELHANYKRLDEIGRWLQGDFHPASL